MVALDDLGRRRAARPGPPRRAVRRPAAVGATTRCSTCSPGRYPSDAFAELRPRAGLGPGHRDAHRRGPARSGWRSPAAARSPTAGCSASSSSAARRPAGRAGSASSTRRWSTSRGSATSSCSARPSWRIEDITHDRVLVTPAPGPARAAAVLEGRRARPPGSSWAARSGAFLRELGGRRPRRAPERARRGRPRRVGRRQPARLPAPSSARRPATCPTTARSSSSGSATSSATGGSWSTPRSARRCTRRGRWRSPARLRERYGVDVQAMHADDGIVLRLPDTELLATGRRAARAAGRRRGVRRRRDRGDSSPPRSAARRCSPPGSASARPGRCCCPAATPAGAPRCGSSGSGRPSCSRWPASTAPSRSCSRRCASACRTSSTCPGLVELMRDIEARRVRVVEVETPQPSPFARSLLFGYVAQFLYEGDSPAGRAARRRRSRSTRRCSPSCSGQAELRELLDADALAEVEAELQRLTDGPAGPRRRGRRRPAARPRRPDDRRGDRPRRDAAAGCAELEARPAGDPGAHRRRGALGRDRGRRPAARRARRGAAGRRARGVPRAGRATRSATCVARYARTHGPFAADDVADRLGLGVAVVARRAGTGSPATGRVVAGRVPPRRQSAPSGATPRCCARCGAARWPRCARRSSRCRRGALARFLPAWQGVGRHALRGVDGVLRVVEQLAGRAGAGVGAGVAGAAGAGSPTTPRALLDELTAAGEVVWAGAGALPGDDGWVVAAPRPTPRRCCCPPPDAARRRPRCTRRVLRRARPAAAALFFRALADRVGADGASRRPTLAAGACGTWSGPGALTNDTLAPLRALLGGRTRGAPRRAAPTPRGRYGRAGAAGAAHAVPVRAADRRRALVAAAAARARPDPARRTRCAETLLDRHGVVTRGAVVAERVSGGFAAVYRVLAAFEETGRCRRGYFVEGLGAAQFATARRGRPAARGSRRSRTGREPRRRRLRAGRRPTRPTRTAPRCPGPTAARRPADRRPRPPPGPQGRARSSSWSTASCVLYVERGGRTLLSFSDDPAAAPAGRRRTRPRRPRPGSSASCRSSGPTGCPFSTPRSARRWRRPASTRRRAACACAPDPARDTGDARGRHRLAGRAQRSTSALAGRGADEQRLPRPGAGHGRPASATGSARSRPSGKHLLTRIDAGSHAAHPLPHGRQLAPVPPGPALARRTRRTDPGRAGHRRLAGRRLPAPRRRPATHRRRGERRRAPRP